MTRILARALSMTVLAGAAALLGACSADDAVTVSIVNLSTTDISATAQTLGERREPSEPQRVTIPIGSEVAMSFREETDVFGVTVEIAPSQTGPGSTPYLVEMTPPGPYLLRVNGNAENLAVSRTDAGPVRGPGVPPDPRDRGFIDDIPPRNPSR